MVSWAHVIVLVSCLLTTAYGMELWQSLNYLVPVWEVTAHTTLTTLTTLASTVLASTTLGSKILRLGQH